MFGVYNVNIGLASLVNFMNEYMTKNGKRNSKQQLVYNCTGHQSVMIMQSIPYCILSWRIERLLWIGYMKNNQCLLNKLPKDLIKYIIKFLHCIE